MLVIMSRKSYRFPNPTLALAPTQEQIKKGVKVTAKFHEAYVEVHGARPTNGVHSGGYGNAKEVPDWVGEDGMFKLAVADHDIVVIKGVGSQATSEERAAEAAKQATLRSLSGDNPAPDSAVAEDATGAADSPDSEVEPEAGPVFVGEGVVVPAGVNPPKKKNR